MPWIHYSPRSIRRAFLGYHWGLCNQSISSYLDLERGGLLLEYVDCWTESSMTRRFTQIQAIWSTRHFWVRLYNFQDVTEVLKQSLFTNIIRSLRLNERKGVVLRSSGGNNTILIRTMNKEIISLAIGTTAPTPMIGVNVAMCSSAASVVSIFMVTLTKFLRFFCFCDEETVDLLWEFIWRIGNEISRP